MSSLKSPLPKLHSPFLVHPNSKVNLSKIATDLKDGFASESAAATVLRKHREQLAKLQEVFYAGEQYGLLIVLQGMDTAGKDGTISHIFSGINPQGCDVKAFKVPTPVEVRHDYLWRAHAAVPARGMFQIFNRSHYEDVLFPRVHGTVSKKLARQRFEEINAWEQMLSQNGVAILKFYLHISFEEQGRRLQERLDTPNKHWKVEESDFRERLIWPQYQEAYEDLLEHTSHRFAPWFVIPSDHKWYRNVAVSQILVGALRGMDLKYPTTTVDVSKLKVAKAPTK